jgi:hypothetical protein
LRALLDGLKPHQIGHQTSLSSIARVMAVALAGAAVMGAAMEVEVVVAVGGHSFFLPENLACIHPLYRHVLIAK